jgi:hypothetical protein
VHLVADENYQSVLDQLFIALEENEEISPV